MDVFLPFFFLKGGRWGVFSGETAVSGEPRQFLLVLSGSTSPCSLFVSGPDRGVSLRGITVAKGGVFSRWPTVVF